MGEALVDPSQMQLEAFVELAVSLGAKLLYLETFEQCHIDQTDMVDPGDKETLGKLANVREATEHLQGSLSELRAGFVHGGVLHVWEESSRLQQLQQASVDLIFESADLVV